MGKRFVGAIFCLIAAILFSSRYIAAAIFMNGIASWSAELFSSGLKYIGPELYLLSIISLILGISYLIWAEVSEISNKRGCNITDLIVTGINTWKNRK